MTPKELRAIMRAYPTAETVRDLAHILRRIRA